MRENLSLHFYIEICSRQKKYRQVYFVLRFEDGLIMDYRRFKKTGEIFIALFLIINMTVIFALKI